MNRGTKDMSFYVERANRNLNYADEAYLWSRDHRPAFGADAARLIAERNANLGIPEPPVEVQFAGSPSTGNGGTGKCKRRTGGGISMFNTTVNKRTLKGVRQAVQKVTTREAREKMIKDRGLKDMRTARERIQGVPAAATPPTRPTGYPRPVPVPAVVRKPTFRPVPVVPPRPSSRPVSAVAPKRAVDEDRLRTVKAGGIRKPKPVPVASKISTAARDKVREAVIDYAAVASAASKLPSSPASVTPEPPRRKMTLQELLAIKGGKIEKKKFVEVTEPETEPEVIPASPQSQPGPQSRLAMPEQKKREENLKNVSGVKDSRIEKLSRKTAAVNPKWAKVLGNIVRTVEPKPHPPKPQPNTTPAIKRSLIKPTKSVLFKILEEVNKA